MTGGVPAHLSVPRQTADVPEHMRAGRFGRKGCSQEARKALIAVFQGSWLSQNGLSLPAPAPFLRKWNANDFF